MNKCAWKYYLKFALRNFILIFSILGLVSLIFIVFSVNQNNTYNEFEIISYLLRFGLLIFVMSNCFLFKFARMIKKQKLEFGVEFNDLNVSKLSHLVYLSQDWLIDCGTCALLRKSIIKITHVLQHGIRGGTSVKVTIYTTNNKSYNINVRDEQQVEELRLWATYSKFKMYKSNSN